MTNNEMFLIIVVSVVCIMIITKFILMKVYFGNRKNNYPIEPMKVSKNK